MYKQTPGDPIKKLDSPTTFSERSTFMKLAKDPSNEMFNTGEDGNAPLNSNHDKGDKIKTEKLNEVVVYAERPNRKKPSEVGGNDAQVSGGKKFTVKKGKPVI